MNYVKPDVNLVKIVILKCDFFFFLGIQHLFYYSQPKKTDGKYRRRIHPGITGRWFGTGCITNRNPEIGGIQKSSQEIIAKSGFE